VVSHLKALGREVTDGALVAQHGEVVLAAARNPWLRDVPERPREFRRGSRRSVGRRLKLPHLRGKFLGAREQRGLLVTLRPCHLGAERLLLRSRGLECDECRTIGGVGLENGVYQGGVFAAGNLARPDDVGFGADELEVDHAWQSNGAGLRSTHDC
jgi:hypothetical protein